MYKCICGCTEHYISYGDTVCANCEKTLQTKDGPVEKLVNKWLLKSKDRSSNDQC